MSDPMRNRRHWLWPLAAVAAAAAAQTPGPPNSATAVAIRCVLSSGRLPEIAEVRYFYIDDARRGVFDTAGNELGSVLQYSAQRIVVYQANAEGGARTSVFDRMTGSLTMVAGPGAASRPLATLVGECQKIDASRPKF